MADQDNLSGRTIGEFVIRERIASGGFGAVYACEQPLLGRQAVIKVLHPDLIRSDATVQRFKREAKLASRLDHPYAAHIYAFGIEPDRLLWIAMERVHGVTLARWVTTHGPMPLGQFVAFFRRIAEVVQTAHDYGIVHRDLKPSNVMVIERAGKLLPKLLDLGVAKLFDGAVLPEGTLEINVWPLPATDDLPGNRPVRPVRVAREAEISTATQTPVPGRGTLTRRHQTLGSPPYMSPEQWGDPGTVGPASDLYALGVLAFEALTGHRPFQGATVAELSAQHYKGLVPALGGSFPPALDRVVQRALAKRPEDRWGSALELADALRSASGLDADQADRAGRGNLPKLDEDVRDAWLGEAPQPLAESVAALDAARNAHQARDAAQELVRNLLRYLLALALATRPRTGDDPDDPALLELVRALRKRELSAEERLQLLRLLVRPHGDHPIPALVDLVTPGPDGTDALAPILGLYAITDHSGSEDSVRRRMALRLPMLSQLLRQATCLLDHVLVVSRGGTAERWTGLRRPHRALAAVRDGALVDDHPMLLDRNGHICADLWPLVQAAAPDDGAAPELFVFDGRGRHGAQLIAAPRGLVRDDANAWDWVATHLIDEVEAKARMRDRISTAARQWQDQARPTGLLWRGDVLAGYERWTRHTAAPPLGDPEAAFLAASRRAERRRRWGGRALIAAGVAVLLGAVEYRAVWQARMAEHDLIQGEVEQGRQALLHDELAEALLHLSEAYRRGDHSPGVVFMLARALQPRMAELARFVAAKGRMWSAAFSPNGQQIVTSDDTCAQIWDAQTGRLLFTLPHGVEVYQAVYSLDGAKLVTVTADLVRIWDTASGALVRELKQIRSDGKPTDYYLVALSPNGKLVAAIDAPGEVAHVWDASTGAALAELRNDGSEFPSVAFSGDGHWLATSGGDDVRVFDTSTWARAVTIAGPRIRSLSFDPTGPCLATGSSGGDSSLWAIPSGARVRHLREIGEPVDKIVFSPNGELVVTASRGGAEQVWNARSGALQSQFDHLRGKILSIEFDSTSKLVLAAGASGSVVVANAALGTLVVALHGPHGIVRVAHFAPSSSRVVGASWDGTVRVWDATSPYLRWSSPPISDDCGLATSLVSDQRFIAIGCRNHTTRVWDTAHDQLLAELPSVTPVHGDFESAFPAVDASGDRAALARGNLVEIYELPGGRLLRTVSHVAPVNAVAFGPAEHDLVSGDVDGSLLVTRDEHESIALPLLPGGIDTAVILSDGRVVATAAKRLRVYDPDHNTILADLEIPTRVRSLRPSPDGLRLIAVPSYLDKTPPSLWDLEHYRLIPQIAGRVGRVFSARFVDDGHKILTVAGDGAARLWDGVTGQLLQTYRGSPRFLADATISPDGSIVVAGDADGLLRFWDASSAKPLWMLHAHQSHVVGVHFEGNGTIVTRGFAGDVARWSLPTPQAVIEACGQAGEEVAADGEPCAIVPR